MVRIAEIAGIRMPTVRMRLVEFINPQAAHLGRFVRPLAPVALIVRAAIPICAVQAFHQCGWQGSRRQQHTRAQQPGPMHQARERGEISHVEIIGFVEHQIARHQPQHGRDLAAAAQAFGGGREVVDGADQQRRGQQRAGLGITGEAHEQWVLVIALEQHLPAFIEQVLAGSRAGGFGLCFVIREQVAAGRAAYFDGELGIVEVQVVLKAAPGLQSQRTQAHGEGTAQARFGVGQRVHDAGVAQRFAAAGGGHIHDECAVLLRPLAHAGTQICRLVLPLKTQIVSALHQGAVVRQCRQRAHQAWQGACDDGGMGLHAQQVLVQRLVAHVFASSVGCRVGEQFGGGLQIRRPLRHFFVAQRAVRVFGVLQAVAGVMVVGQHEAEPCHMRGERVAGP